MYRFDNRVVMTLDAGGTKLVFSAIQANKEVVEPVHLPSQPNSIDKTLETLVTGFSAVQQQLKSKPVAISFAFPGPSDYKNGIIGDLPNFPAFRGGVALGPFLHHKFNLPVFINNDGDLYAYGEALAGVLPQINEKLKQSGSPKRYRNLLGLTFGTGFGAGVTVNGEMFMGDNNCGADIWCFRNMKYPQYIVEESVSIRAVKRVYAEISGEKCDNFTPKDIFDIAEGTAKGDQQAARQSFAEMGQIAGDAIANALTIVDGIVAIGGGLAGAGKHFMPALIGQLNSTLDMMNGSTVPRIQSRAFSLEDEIQLQEFLKKKSTTITIPGTDQTMEYDPERRIGVAITKIGTSRAIALGAYAFSLNELDKAQSVEDNK